MIVRRLSVANVRSHSEKVVDLSPNVTVITGLNGIGKTTLLESLYIALQGKSFKGVDKDIIRKGAPWYRIDLILDDDSVRSVTFDESRTSGKKRFHIDDKISYRLTSSSKHPVVLFEPEDLRLLNGSPSRRRAFIDTFISQIQPTYGSILRKYERALKQRNNLLKQPDTTRDDLFVWNVALSEYGARIMKHRIHAVSLINEQIGRNYHSLAHTEDRILVKYSDIEGVTAQSLLRKLESCFSYDITVKHTSVGPHRHDILFFFNDSPALSIASRGEVRTILLALKKVEVDIITEVTGKHPFILLDDVFSELDKDRQDYIVNYFSSNQVVISSATNDTRNNFLHIEL